MPYFSQEYCDFFDGLEENNHRDWFHSNKKVYEKHVKGTFEFLLNDLLPRLKSLDSDINMSPKDGIFRINRDVRFSKDKTPYNTIMKAGFAKNGRKSSFAGYYLGISSSKIHVGGGAFMLPSEDLSKIRHHICNHSDEFQALVSNDSFTSKFGAIQGEKIKRIPAEFKDTFTKIPEVANKQFYYMTEIPVSPTLFADNIIDQLIEHFELITPLNQYLKTPL